MCLIVPRGQFPAFAPKHAESPAVLRISYGHDQLNIRPTVVTGNNTFSALKRLRNLKSHGEATVNRPPGKKIGAET